MSQDNNTLSIFVAEEIKTKDVPPGSATPAAETPEQKEQREMQAAIAEAKRLESRYVDPHKNKSRWVTEADINKVIEDGKDMMVMCSLPRGLARFAKAIAHSQITTDPLRFFVFPNGKVIVNPVIIGHTSVPVYKDNEGCMTYPNSRVRNNVPRFNKIDVTFQTLGVKQGDTAPSLTPPIFAKLGGEEAHIFQHECDHLNGGYVYDKDHTPERATWFGEGPTEMPVWEFKQDEPKEEQK
jgi:peptide deformylase